MDPKLLAKGVCSFRRTINKKINGMKWHPMAEIQFGANLEKLKSHEYFKMDAGWMAEYL